MGAIVQDVNMGNHSWSNYFLAAYKVRLEFIESRSWRNYSLLTACLAKGVFEYLGEKGQAPKPQGLHVAVDGQVPQGDIIHT